MGPTLSARKDDSTPARVWTRARRRGFTLVELLVAVLIAGIFFAAAAPVFVNALRVTRDDTARVTAQSIAQEKMEQIRRLQFNELPKLTDGSVDLSTWMGGAFTTTVEGYVGTAAKTYTVAYTVAFEPASASPTAAQRAQVEVRVSWTDVNGRPAHLKLGTVLSRQFSGPGVQKVTLSPVNMQTPPELNGSPTTVTVYLTPQDAGENNANISSVAVTVADVDNSSFTPAVLTATPAAAGVYTATWDQSGATVNDTFSFTALATDISGTPGNPFTVSAKLVTAADPNPVTGLTIAEGDRRLLLTWDDSAAASFDHYEIWRGPSPSAATQLVESIQASGYIDTGLTNGTTYHYQVRVVDTEGNVSPWVTGSGAPSVQADVTEPDTPGSFTATRVNANAVLAWTVPGAGPSGLAGYFIYRDGEPYARFAPGGEVGVEVTYEDVIGYSLAHTYSVVAFSGVGLISAATPTLTVDTATAPLADLTVTTTRASAVSINLVQTDVRPDPRDAGTKTATSLAGAVWTGLPCGMYRITATHDGQQVIRNITLTQNTTVTSGF